MGNLPVFEYPYKPQMSIAINTDTKGKNFLKKKFLFKNIMKKGITITKKKT